MAAAIQIATKNEIKETPMAFVVIAKTPTLRPPFTNPHFKLLISALFLLLLYRYAKTTIAVTEPIGSP